MIGTNNTVEKLRALELAQLKALKGQADALKTEHDGLTAGVKAKVTKLNDLTTFIANLTTVITEKETPSPQPTVTATAQLNYDEEFLNKMIVTVTLTGAKVKDVDHTTIKLFKNGAPMTFTGLDIADWANNETTEFEFTVDKMDVVKTGMTVEFMVKGSKVTANVTVINMP